MLCVAIIKSSRKRGMPSVTFASPRPAWWKATQWDATAQGMSVLQLCLERVWNVWNVWGGLDLLLSVIWKV